jgi:RimJ/RimL family protein N-acetyltransferase
MPEPIEFMTERLRLRQWETRDREPFAAMNADPDVMRYFAEVGTRESSNRTVDIWQSEIEGRGWSNWAVEHAESKTFIGFVGLSVPRRALPFMPCVEIGWRLAKAHWGKGFATEAAKGALRVGFERLNLEEIVSFTSLVNQPSRAVMERIGMINSEEDFDHPALPEGSELRRHCLYKISREHYASRRLSGQSGDPQADRDVVRRWQATWRDNPSGQAAWPTESQRRVHAVHAGGQFAAAAQASGNASDGNKWIGRERCVRSRASRCNERREAGES